MTDDKRRTAIIGGIILLAIAALILARRNNGRAVAVPDPDADTDTDPGYAPDPNIDDATYYTDYNNTAPGSSDTTGESRADMVNPPDDTAEKVRHGNQGKLRATTYNIKYTSSNGDVQQSLTRLLPNADVMVLNEFTASHAPVFAWLSARGWGHYYPKGSDTAIIYRKSATTYVDGKRYELSPPTWVEFPEHDDKTNNAVTRREPAVYAPAATLNVDGKIVTIIGAHTVSHVHNENGKRPKRGALQTLQFQKLVSAIRQESRRGLVIGAGDLNYDPIHERATARNVTAILADAHLRSNWTWLGEHGNGTLRGRFVDQFLTLIGQEPKLKLTGQSIVTGLHSDHNAVQATYQL